MFTRSKFRPLAVLSCMVMVILALFCIENIEVGAEDYSGYCGAEGDGTNLRWSLDTETGVLNITGSGEMADYSSSPSNRSPWYSNKSYVKIVNIRDGVTNIGKATFYECYSITSLTISDSVISIGDYAFYDCYRMTSVTIPDSVTSIGDYAFYYCSRLKSVSIGNSVTRIGDYAFVECDMLTSVTFPDSVKSIGKYAFVECINLISVTVADGVESIGDYAFSYCYSLTDVIIGSGVTSIGVSAFAECESLKSVIFKATDCWRVVASSEAAIGTPIDISVPSVAKDQLTSKYAEYYWYHHNYTAVTVDPTCTTDGYTTYTCSECEYGYTEVQNALGHTEVIEEAVAPTCTETGMTEGRYCSACEAVLAIRETVNALGHRYESVVTAPTCSDGGYTMYTCICGDSYVDNRTEKLDHSYGDDGVCESCGAKAPDAGNNSNGNGGSDNGNGNGGSNNNGSSSKGGCGGGTGMYISYLFTVLIPASFVFLGKFLFF